MPRQVALMRSVNLGPINKVSMAALRSMLEALGLEQPKTLLMTGNLVFGSRKSPAALESLLERETAARLSLTTDFHVRTAIEWPPIVEANPFRAEAASNPTFLTATVLRRAPTRTEVRALERAIKGSERVAVVDRTLYTVWPDGQGRSKLTLPVIERSLATRGTTRNWNTVLRIAEALS